MSTFLVGNSYKSSFVEVTGWRVDPKDTLSPRPKTQSEKRMKLKNCILGSLDIA